MKTLLPENIVRNLHGFRLLYGAWCPDSRETIFSHPDRRNREGTFMLRDSLVRHTVAY
jgi:hypothetical protein